MLWRGRLAVMVVAAGACGGIAAEQKSLWKKVPLVAFDSLFRQVDSAVLVTNPGDAIGIATSVVVEGTSLILTDVTQGNLKVFSKRGTLLQIIGRPGDGPGEFRNPLAAVRTGTGKVVVLDVRRHVLSVRDSAGALIQDLVVPGSWSGLTPLPGTGHVVLAGPHTTRAGPGDAQAVDPTALHEIDEQGEIVASFHSFKWPSDPFQASFTNFFVTTVGDLLLVGNYVSNRVFFVDRSSGREWSVRVGGPWYREPEWNVKPVAKSGSERVKLWAQKQMLLTRLFGIDKERYLAGFRTYSAIGDEQFYYVIADTAGTSRIAAMASPIRILTMVHDTAFGVETSPSGQVILRTLLLRSASRSQ